MYFKLHATLDGFRPFRLVKQLRKKGVKVKVGWFYTFVVMVAFGIVPNALAETPSGNSEKESVQKQTLEEKSLDPTSDLTQFQVQNRFIPSTFDVDGYANILNIRILKPVLKSHFFPIRTIWRATFPIITAPGGPTGLSDIRLLGIGILGERDLGKGRWWRWGLGPVFVFPSATEDVLGSEKWQAGPTAAGIFHTKKWQFAFIVQNPVSFAGDSNRADVNRLIWQPIFVYWLPKQWYLGLQGTAKSINWENDAALTLPVAVRIGKVTQFGPRAVNVFVEPEYTAIHDDNFPAPEWSIQLGFNFLFPL